MAYQTSDQLNNSRERSRVVLSNSHDWLAQEYQWDPYRLIAARSSPPATHAEGKTPVHASGKTPIVGAVPAAWDGKVSTPVDEGGLIVGAEPTILSASKRAYDRSLPLICQVRNE